MELYHQIVDFLLHALDIFLHLDIHLNEWISLLGPSIYILLFVIVFCETGLVVTPFLPGDSLLFALGALCATPNSSLSITTLTILLSVAAILGDATNYAIGRHVGPRIFHSSTSRFLNREHLTKARDFYERYGGKTILFARFIPIIRTFAPFVAGIGQMNYLRFSLFNVTGGLLWILICLMAGYLFGNIPVVKTNFEFVILSIIAISCLPMVIEFLRSRSNNKNP